LDFGGEAVIVCASLGDGDFHGSNMGARQPEWDLFRVAGQQPLARPCKL
jgi:hypothetical protein